MQGFGGRTVVLRRRLVSHTVQHYDRARKVVRMMTSVGGSAACDLLRYSSDLSAVVVQGLWTTIESSQSNLRGLTFSAFSVCMLFTALLVLFCRERKRARWVSARPLVVCLACNYDSSARLLQRWSLIGGGPFCFAIHGL